MKEHRALSSMARATRGTGWAATALCLLALAAAGGAAATPEAAAPPIKTITADQLRTMVNAHKGKVVVVNFWASWCPPCVREFPAIIKAYKQYHGKGLDVVAVSMNSPDEMTDVKAFLHTYKPPFPIYLAANGDGTFYKGVLKDWYGEMPMTLVFNTAGKDVLVHRAEITYPELSSKVKALLPAQ